MLLLRTLSATEVRKICSDGAGGAYFAWNDTRSSPQPSNPFYYRVYMQHVLGDGTIDPRWPADGLPVAPGPYGRYDFDLVEDGAGGLFAAWQEFRDDAGWRIYARRFRPDGSSAPGWPEEGLLVSNNEIYEVFPKLVSDGQGGFWAMWETLWNGTTVQRYAHRDSLGQVAPGSSGDGEVLATPSRYPFPISDAKGGVYVAFQRPGSDGVSRVYAQRIYGDGPTAALPSLLSAEASSGVATLRWSVSASLPGGGRVERSSGDDMWASIGSPVEVGTRMIEFVDEDLAAGRYGYRLAWIENGVERRSAETWVEVEGGLRLALAGFRPNPAVGVAALAFSLPDDRPARLEVLDVKGRVVRSRDVGELGGGSHVVSLADGAPLAAGMYWLRLSHPERTLTAKGIVVR